MDDTVVNKMLTTVRSSRQEVFCEKGVLKNFTNSQENTCARVSFLIKKETLAQVFPYEFCDIFKNTFFYRTSPVEQLFSNVQSQ